MSLLKSVLACISPIFYNERENARIVMVRARDMENLLEKMNFLTDYLKENEYNYFQRFSRYILEGTEKPEILLEVAAKISFNKALSMYAMFLIDYYEDELFRLGIEGYPFMVHSVREMVCRNMITVESNVSNKCLYAILMSNNSVKIGVATDINRRFSQIQSSSGMTIKKAIYTDIFKNAHSEETRLHRKYKKHRMNGEYFNIMFSCVQDDIERIADKEKVEIYEK